MYYSIHQRTEMLYSAPIYQSAIGVMSMVTVPIVKETGRTVKVTLGADDLPTDYYNILPDLPIPLPPPIHPGTKEPIGPEALAPIFPMEIIRQEVSTNRFEPIPEEVREADLTLGRPAPDRKRVVEGKRVELG